MKVNHQSCSPQQPSQNHSPHHPTIQTLDDHTTAVFDIFHSDEYQNEQVFDEDVHADEEEERSLSLGRLLRDGIAGVFEHLERVLTDPYSDLKGRDAQIDVPWISAAKCGDLEETKGDDSVRSEIGAVSCPICMENWTTDGEHSVCSLPCGHLYGMSCIQRWLQQQDQGKCPQCKKICNLGDVRKIYGPFVVADNQLQEKIRLHEAKCATLELKLHYLMQDSEWIKKEVEWRRKEEELSRKIVGKEKHSGVREWSRWESLQ